MDLKGKTIAIVGLARSGISAAKLCALRGARVIVSDSAPASSLDSLIGQLGTMLDKVETGTNTVKFLSQADLIVVSPGVPLAIPALAEIRKRGIPIIAEVELASSMIDCPIIGITGSNGKTTTTELTGNMFRLSGFRTFVGGNIGTSLSELPLSGKTYDVAVVELSSFQLEAIENFSASAAGLLNITEDHLDRYPDFEAYANAKMRLIQTLKKKGVAVCNWHDDQSRTRCSALQREIIYFGSENYPGAYLKGGTIVVNDPKGKAEFSLNRFSLPGVHNLQNAMAAILLARAVDATDEGIQKALDTAEPLEHRIEPVKSNTQVLFFNDSKATSPSSVITALAAFKEPVVLLIGGRDKGSDFSVLNESIRKKTKMIVCFGESADRIAKGIGANVPVKSVETMEQAVKEGFTACQPGDTLLLSPGCASFDEFRNYEHRGQRFKELVNGL